MSQIRYTQKELEDAKEYLRQRIRNEQSMTLDVERLLDEYAGYLLHAMFNGASRSDIELLIEDLIERIMDDCRMLAIDEHDDDDEAVALVFGEGEDSVEERVRNRAMTFLDELTVAYSAAEILQMDEKTLLASVKASMDHPWDNEAISEVRGMILRGEVDDDLVYYQERHYGRGIPTSSKVGLEMITVSAVADMWNESDWRTASALGAKGYYVERGSSWPCEECNSHTGIFYPIDDREHIPQYHRNCRCFVVYCYDKADMDGII